MGNLITRAEILMNRDKEYPLSEQLKHNLDKTHKAANIVRDAYGVPLIASSGYRPGRFNKAAHGAENSSHLTCEAIDFEDKDGKFAAWCLQNLAILEKAGLYMEDPKSTKGWVHLQTRKPKSGNRVFKP